MSQDDRKHIVVDESLFYELRDLKLSYGVTWTGLFKKGRLLSRGASGGGPFMSDGSPDLGPGELSSLRRELSDRENLSSTADALLLLLAEAVPLDPEQRAALLDEEEE
jgi:hypothetical protein